jgi:hypothetical protein
MTGSDCINVASMIAKLFPTITPEQTLVLTKRLPELRIDYEQAIAALNEELLSPTTAKVAKVAAIWDRLKRCGASTNQPGADGWKAPETFGEVLQAQWRSGEHPAQLVQKYILGLQAKCRERQGEPYAEAHAWKQWTVWRSDLIDAGMDRESATAWLVANTEVEQAWADDLERRMEAGRDRQVARFKRMAAEGTL